MASTPTLAARCRLDRLQAIVEIGVHRYDPAAPAASIPIRQYRALIDTGATKSCLTYRTIGSEQLVRHGRKLVKNVHNQNLHGLYMATIGIVATHRIFGGEFEPSPSYFGLPGPVELMDIADNDRFDAILGMDVLQHHSFEFARDGEFMLLLP